MKKRWKVALAVVIVATAAWGGYAAYAPVLEKQILLNRVKQGDVVASTKLSKIYRWEALDHCDDIPRSRQIVARSRELLLPYADAGDTDAMVLLAENYREGMCENRPGDRERAHQWFEKAANLGNVAAMSALYMSYFGERGERAAVEEANVKGLMWFMRAADAGYAPAQVGLGHRYLLGVGGVPQDDNKAREYLEKASADGSAGAKRDLALLHATSSEIWANRHLTIPLLVKAAEGGDQNAPYDLMAIYYKGEFVPKNYAEARRWGKTAVRYSPAGQLLMAKLYFEGKGGEKDMAEAYAWASIAAASDGAVDGTRRFLEQVESEIQSSDREKGQTLAASYAKGLQTL
jgi:TPR repeat protein